MKNSVTVDQVRSPNRLKIQRCKELHPFGPVVAPHNPEGSQSYS